MTPPLARLNSAVPCCQAKGLKEKIGVLLGKTENEDRYEDGDGRPEALHSQGDGVGASS